MRSHGFWYADRDVSRSSDRPTSSSPRAERTSSTPSARAIGAAVRAERKRQGLTQEQLALVAGVGSRSVGLIEMGKETAQLDVLIRLLDALGLDLEVKPRRSS